MQLEGSKVHRRLRRSNSNHWLHQEQRLCTPVASSLRRRISMDHARESHSGNSALHSGRVLQCARSYVAGTYRTKTLNGYLSDAMEESPSHEAETRIRTCGKAPLNYHDLQYRCIRSRVSEARAGPQSRLTGPQNINTNCWLAPGQLC